MTGRTKIGGHNPATRMKDPYALQVSCQYVTPTCRENRGTTGALDEAIQRLRKAYLAYADAPENASVHWHFVLYRVEDEAKAKLVRPL